MTRWTAWWHELPGPAKFRLYTRITLQGGLALLIVVVVNTARSPWSAAAIVTAGTAALLALETRAEFATSTNTVTRRWVQIAATTVLTAVWLAAALVARSAHDEPTGHQADMVGIATVLLAGFSVVPFSRRKWWLPPALGAATGLAFGSSPEDALRTGTIACLGGLLAVAATAITVWCLRIVDELEHAKTVEAELQVAQERLRFARDLHDVVGRGFSAIAVKSELAGALARTGDIERAAAEMDEVRTLAAESMGQMRKLVRGYRDIDLLGEVAGARSLLSAVGCRLVVEGDPATVPTRFHEVTAWVVREGTTNIVEHSAATSATLTFGRTGMSLRNDHPHSTLGAQSGLRGLAERLAAVGATLEVVPDREEFLLEIHWSAE